MAKNLWVWALLIVLFGGTANAGELTAAEKKALAAGQVVTKVIYDKGVETVISVTPYGKAYKVYQYIVEPGQSSNEMSLSLRAGRYVGDKPAAPRGKGKVVSSEDLSKLLDGGEKADPLDEMRPWKPKKIKKTREQLQEERRMRAWQRSASQLATAVRVELGKINYKRTSCEQATRYLAQAKAKLGRLQYMSVRSIRAANRAQTLATSHGTDAQAEAADAHRKAMMKEALASQYVTDDAIIAYAERAVDAAHKCFVYYNRLLGKMTQSKEMKQFANLIKDPRLKKEMAAKMGAKNEELAKQREEMRAKVEEAKKALAALKANKELLRLWRQKMLSEYKPSKADRAREIQELSKRYDALWKDIERVLDVLDDGDWRAAHRRASIRASKLPAEHGLADRMRVFREEYTALFRKAYRGKVDKYKPRVDKLIGLMTERHLVGNERAKLEEQGRAEERRRRKR